MVYYIPEDLSFFDPRVFVNVMPKLSISFGTLSQLTTHGLPDLHARKKLE